MFSDLVATLTPFIGRSDNKELAFGIAPGPPGRGPRGLAESGIPGHTDVVPFAAAGGRFRDNCELSAGRAIATCRLLGETHSLLHGLRNRDGDALLGVSGYAENRSATTDPDRLREDIRDLDRRIEVRLTMTTNEAAGRQSLEALNQQWMQVDDLLR